MGHATSEKSVALRRSIEPLVRFYSGGLFQQHARRPGIGDFAFGNPHDPPVAGLSEALKQAATPRSKDWFAYKNSEPESRTLVAASLRARDGLPYLDDDICMNNGAFGGLAAALDAIADPGDEVIYNSPPSFFYEALTLDRGAVPVRVQVDPRTWDLDLQAIARALTPRTRAIIVDSPHNPTGRIYPPQTLQARPVWAFPNAILQHALAELDTLSIDVARIQRRRDRLVSALRGFGYTVHEPQATFDLLPRSPISDDWAFAERLAERNVLTMPGQVAELPGYFRLSLTASDDMVERALPALEAAIG